MSKLKFLFLFFIFAVPGYARDCFYKVDAKKAKVTWTAFTTQARLRVSGSFKVMSLSGITGEEVALKQVLSSGELLIDTASVDSGIAARDSKVRKFFFEKITDGKAPQFRARLLRTYGAESGKADLELFIEETRHLVPVTYSWDGSMLRLQGKIDLISIGLTTAFQSISKACELKSERKTWSDIDLKFEIPLAKGC